ncbi:MAG: endonuclease/exonuclease/phosphatase family protein [Chitinophagales bacterium]
MKKAIVLFIITLFFLPTNAESLKVVEDEHLRILSWNIYMLPGIANLSKQIEKNQKRQRAVEIGEMISASDYDIVVFQESFFAPARRKLKKALKKAYPYMYGPINRGGFGLKTSSGIFIVSKIPLTELGTTQYRSCNGADCFAKKGAGLFEGEWNGKTFQILGTHLNAGGPQWIREEQYKQIADELLFPHQKMGVPQIICGDMNTHREDSDGKYETMLSALDCLDTPTYGERQTTTVKDKGIIDYILYRPNESSIQIIDKQIRVFTTDTEVVDKLGGTLSDHLGVDLVVEL